MESRVKQIKLTSWSLSSHPAYRTPTPLPGVTLYPQLCSLVLYLGPVLYPLNCHPAFASATFTSAFRDWLWPGGGGVLVGPPVCEIWALNAHVGWRESPSSTPSRHCSWPRPRPPVVWRAGCAQPPPDGGPTWLLLLPRSPSFTRLRLSLPKAPLQE